MLVQVNTGSRVEGGAPLAESIEERVRDRLARHAERLTRIEIHLEDQDGARNGADGIEARIEARPAGGQPVTVSARGATPDGAANDAVQKMRALLDSHFGKLDGR